MIVLALIAAFGAASAHAQVPTCTLTLIPGGAVMTMASDGKTMGSENPLGLSASLTVAGLSTAPQVSFSNNMVTGPTGWGGSPTTFISATSAGGVRQAYTSGNFTVRSALRTDILVINAKVLSASGFKAGNYEVSTQVTCQAP